MQLVVWGVARAPPGPLPASDVIAYRMLRARAAFVPYLLRSPVPFLPSGFVVASLPILTLHERQAL